MPSFSVITPLFQPNSQFLLDAYNSLQHQEGEWEWLLQWDGQADDLPPVLQADARVHIAANGRRLGAAGTRNRALMRARAPYIQNLDADDQLQPGTLGLLAGLLEEHPTAAFAFGHSTILLPDGSTTSRDYTWSGMIAPGGLYRVWEADQFRVLPMHPAGVMWRRENLEAMGGWTALSGGEDTCLVMAVAELWPCVASDRGTLIYREHEGQTTAQLEHQQMREQHQQFVRNRVQALRSLGLSDAFLG